MAPNHDNLWRVSRNQMRHAFYYTGNLRDYNLDVDDIFRRLVLTHRLCSYTLQTYRPPLAVFVWVIALSTYRDKPRRIKTRKV